MLQKGVGAVVITLGEFGCFLKTTSMEQRFQQRLILSLWTAQEEAMLLLALLHPISYMAMIYAVL